LHIGCGFVCGNAVGVALKQVIGSNAENVRHLHHLVQFRQGGVAFPLADRLTGYSEAIGQFFLRPVVTFAKFRYFLRQFHFFLLCGAYLYD
jgi:hypothetical protein